MNRLLNKVHAPTWLVIVLALVLIFRLPSFFEPYSYGDEMIYMTLGNGIRQGLTLYKDIHDNKPPLLYLTAAVAGTLFWFKAVLAFWMIATIFLFWKLMLRLFPKKVDLQKLAVVIFSVLTTLPLLEGNIANAELFLIGPIIFAFLILLDSPTDTEVFFSGVLFSVAVLFKVPAVFDIGAIFLYWIIISKLGQKEVMRIAKKTIILLAGLIIPILLTFLWYYFKGAFSDYVRAAFLQNLGYLSSWRPADAEKSFLIRNGPVLFRGVIVVLGAVVLRIKRKNLSKPFIFSCLWLLTSLFAATLSERPYPHYIIQAVPAISVLLTILLGYRSMEQTLAIVPLFIAVFVPVYFKYYHYNTFSYYMRFIRFATGKIDQKTYFSEFDSNVNRNYEISSFIVRSSKNDSKIFVWGDSAPVYALTRRFPPLKYVANYHINDFSSKREVIGRLIASKPEYIVILPGSENFTELSNLLLLRYNQITQIDGASIWYLNR
jgi:hypothetical protein